MDFRDTPEQAAWRTEIRQFVVDNCDPIIRRSGTGYPEEGPTSAEYKAAMDRWRKALAERGWIAAGWPKEYGGGGLTQVEQFIFNQEMAELRAPSLGGIGTMFLGPTLLVHGNEEQKKKYIPGILSGEEQWCQGYSEPGAGSDLASLQTKAVRDGDDWIINGQKIWTSGAHTANWMFCLARSDQDAPKHRGITYFLIDMKTPGITVRPLVNMAGQHNFNEVFLDDVRVPSENIVGEVNRGWYIATTTLDFERSSIGSSSGTRQTVDRYLAWLRTNKDKIPAFQYESIRRKWVDRLVESQILLMFSYRIISMQAAGQIPNSEGSITKLFSSELGQRISQTAMETIGMFGGLRDESAPFNGQVATGYLGSVSGTIAGGTSEIQRTVIATRGLGLPRD